MLFGGRHYDAAALRAYLVADWDATLRADVTDGQREALRRHLDRLLASGEVGAPSHADAQLIARARAVVAGVPVSRLAYERLKQTAAAPEATPFTIESAGGPAALRVLAFSSGRPATAGVPALYSRAVAGPVLNERIHDVLRQLTREVGWVLGTVGPPGMADAATQQAFADEVQRLYRADHAARWSEFLADLRLAPTGSLAATVEQVALMARPDSPLLALLRALVREVSAAAPGDAPAAARFEALERFMVGQPAPVDEMQALFGRLATHLAAVEQTARRRTLPPPGTDALGELRSLAQRAPPPVGAMLSQLATSSTTQSFAGLRGPMSAELAREVTPACLRAVAGRYPLVRNAREEASRDDFARIFGSGGLLDGFFRKRLAPYVDTSARPWAWRAAAAGSNGDVLPHFQRAQQIRDTFFGEGGRRLSTRLEFRLVGIDPGVTELMLDIDGQVMRFRAGSKDAKAVQWPGPGDSGRVRVQLAPSSGSGYVFEGPWSLFRLLDRVRVEPGEAPSRATLSLDVEGRKARLEVRSLSPWNPLLRENLEQFECPRRW
jgi:type VI secretion system protein ImpL